MNLLGHLYLSQNETIESRLFNLLGDKYKGTALLDLTDQGRAGIKMHRDIDHFIDNHKDVLELKHLISQKLPKVSGIAIDILFDHLLAAEWHKFHIDELDVFIDCFFSKVYENPRLVPEKHRAFVKNLEINKYIHQYYDFSSVEAISSHLHRKLSFRTQIDQTPNIFYTFEINIRETFEKYISDARKTFGIS